MAQTMVPQLVNIYEPEDCCELEEAVATDCEPGTEEDRDGTG